MLPRHKLPLAIRAIGAGPAFVIVVGSGFLWAPANFGGAMTAVSGVALSLAGGRFILHERLGPVQQLGMVIAVVGLTILVLVAGASSPGLFVAGGLLWAAYGVAFRLSGLSALEAVTSVALLSAAIYLPAYFWIAGDRLWQVAPQQLVVQGIGQGILTGIVALALHARAVAYLGATKGALFQSLVPAFTLLLSFAFLNERTGGAEMIAIGIILTGVYAVLRFCR